MILQEGAATRILYIVAIPDENLEEASPFQGLSEGLLYMNWALRRILFLPSDLFDLGLPRAARIGRRLTGHGYSWMPLTRSALTSLTIDASDPFWVVFTYDEATTRAVEFWTSEQRLPPLHVTASTFAGPVPAENLDWRLLRDHIAAVGDKIAAIRPHFPSKVLNETLAAWCDPEPFPLGLVARPHNATFANLITLKSLGGEFASEENLIPHLSRLPEWIAAIRESAEAVISLRNALGAPRVTFARPPAPDRIVSAPAVFANVNGRLGRPSADEPAGLRAAIRAIRDQKTYFFTGEREKIAPLLTERAAQFVLELRTRELHFQTTAVALRAASTMAAVIRLANGVNETADIKRFTDHTRGRRLGNIDKAHRVFTDAQRALARHVHPDLRDLLASSQTGVKLIADAPLEWMPLGDLPLGLAKIVSRIPATPGNLMIGELTMTQPILMPVEAFASVRVVSFFQDTDPLRNMVGSALRFMAAGSSGRLKVEQIFVDSSETFIEAVNSFGGAMIIFDGHGKHDTRTGIGTLRIGDEDVDIWSLYGRLRPPPVVVLSACDTHAPDRTHATVGSGFLACGARSVLGTLLPVRGDRAAVFAGRLALRAAWYGEVVVKESHNAILWSEIVGSALRLDMLSHLIDRIEKVKGLSGAKSIALRETVNMRIHMHDPDWWVLAKEDFKGVLGGGTADLAGLIAKTIAASDSIRYIHLGNPETIRLTSREIQRMEDDLTSGRDQGETSPT
ncbi:MAG: CHAT domain-containing protein [Rhodopila sp.]|nr:CHAT domain-containing protein [Rhodopila sp.]